VEVVAGRIYRIVVRFPWGTRVELQTDRASRDEDGTIRWQRTGALDLEPCLDCVLHETDDWVLGLCGGTSDVAVVVSQGPEAPEP